MDHGCCFFVVLVCVSWLCLVGWFLFGFFFFFFMMISVDSSGFVCLGLC